MKQQTLLLVFILTALSPHLVNAQNNNGHNNTGLGGYVPPPLFGSTKKELPPPKLAPTPVVQPSKKLGLPTVSKKIEIKKEPQTPQEKKIIQKPAVITPPPVQVKAPIKPKPQPKPKPKPQVKPQAPKTVHDHGAEPIDLLKSKTKRTVPPAEKIKTIQSEGVVKGPKTMPAVKKQNVEAQTTFEAKKIPKVNVLERVQKQDEKVEAKALPKAAANAQNLETKILNAPKAGITIQKDGSRKIQLSYLEKQTDLQPNHKDIIQSSIISELGKNKSTRLIIQAYASPQDGVLRGDRRLSLSRAMAIRNHLLEQNISPNRIDVRALGAQSDIHPLDRVELFLTP